VGVGKDIVGRFSYDNIIEETSGSLYMRWEASDSENVRHETEPI
jgi:hypothetical protein